MSSHAAHVHGAHMITWNIKDGRSMKYTTLIVDKKPAMALIYIMGK